MCGRVQITSPIEAVTNLFDDLDTAPYTDGDFEWPQIFNAAPATRLPFISQNPNASLQIRPSFWGLIPNWAKDRTFASKTTNARIKTVYEKPSFKDSILHRRGLLPVTAYYEWKTIATQKQPFRHHLARDLPLLLACIWDKWNDPNTDKLINIFSILTTQSDPETCPEISQIHSRIPLVVKPKYAKEWVFKGLPITQSKPDSKYLENQNIQIYPVSTELNSTRNQFATLAVPIEIHQTSEQKHHILTKEICSAKTKVQGLTLKPNSQPLN